MRTRTESTQKGENKNQHQFTHQKAKSSTGFMAELEAWAEETIYKPVEDAFNRDDYKDYVMAKTEGITHLKRKVLASYHNGLKKRSDND